MLRHLSVPLHQPQSVLKHESKKNSRISGKLAKAKKHRDW